MRRCLAPPLLAAALVVLYGGLSFFAVSRDKPLDFAVYYMAAHVFTQGGSPYTLDDDAWDGLAQRLGVVNYARHYRYPALTALLAAPLVRLPPRPAAAIWLAVSSLGLVLGAVALAAALGGARTKSGAPHSPTPQTLVLVALLFFVPPLTALYAGQVTGLLFACLGLALWAWSRGKKVLLGMALAVASLLKVTPLAMVGYLLWRRQWRAFIAAVSGLTVLVFLELLLVGAEGSVSYLRHFTRVAEPTALKTYPSNQALSGFFSRLLTDHYWGPHLVSAPELALTLTLTSAVLLVLLTMAVCWPKGPREKVGELFLLELCLILVALQLVAPFSWYHQITLLFFPFCLLASEILTGRLARWVAPFLLLAYLAVDFHGLLWRHLQGRTWALSLPLYAALQLWLVLAGVIVQRKGWLRLGIQPA